ncbi:MAG TPA: diacylglycerol kinase family protein [Actinomycetota bacterium]|nr:diacylglycerol kinase family protein [Actinomycetota bacterium]
MRVLVAGNPSAGSFDEDVRSEIAGAFAAIGPLEWFTPSSETTASDLVAAAAGAEVVVVAGGDGSLNYAVNALEDRLGELTFALVPTGTGNDYARTLGLPSDPLDAARAAAAGTLRSFDVGRATGGGVSRLFVNACMGGFPVAVNEAIDEDSKRVLGPLAFWVGGAKAATGLERSAVTINGLEAPDCVAAGVGNGRTCGGGIEVWPHADPSDGVLNACALGAPNAAAALQLLLKVRGGKHEGLDGVVTGAAPRLEIDADPPIEFNVDGDLVGLRSPATFEVAGSFRLLV